MPSFAECSKSTSAKLVWSPSQALIKALLPFQFLGGMSICRGTECFINTSINSDWPFSRAISKAWFAFQFFGGMSKLSSVENFIRSKTESSWSSLFAALKAPSLLLLFCNVSIVSIISFWCSFLLLSSAYVERCELFENKWNHCKILYLHPKTLIYRWLLKKK